MRIKGGRGYSIRALYTCIVQLKLYRVLVVCNLKNERFSLVQDVSIVYTGPGEVPCFVHEQRRKKKREAETERPETSK